MNDWNTWKWIIIPELILLLLVILNMWRINMKSKCKFKRKSYERKINRQRVKEFKKMGYFNDEWIGYNYCFIERQRKIITALRDNSDIYPDLQFEDLENIAQEDKIPSGLEVVPQDQANRWKAILSLLIYYLDRMDEHSDYNSNPLDDEFFSVFVNHEIDLDESASNKLRKDWSYRNDKIRKDIEKYKGRFFRLLSKYFFYMWV